MLKHKEVYLIVVLLSLGAMVGGCASGKQVSSSEVPHQPSNESAMSKANWKHAGHYVVKPHDCLWAIAGKRSVYGDSFEWPLLYKANRDLIQDPDLIYPKQNLKIAEGLTKAEISRARQLAESAPKYEPHDKPREKQLTEYF